MKQSSLINGSSKVPLNLHCVIQKRLGALKFFSGDVWKGYIQVRCR